MFVEVERHVRENREPNRLFLDLDIPVGRPSEFKKFVFGFWIPRHWIDFRFSEFLELAVFEAERLIRTFPRLGRRALIYRSSQMGIHIIFPDARLSFKEVEAIHRCSLFCHEGYRYFSRLVQDQTLRVSRKSNADEPKLVRIVSL